jgi:hypothetical protein
VHEQETMYVQLSCNSPCAQGSETRLRPDGPATTLLIGALHALQRLASVPQLQEEMCAVRCFGSLFSLLDCGCDRISMEVARLLTRLWAPAAAAHGAKPFVSRSTGEEYEEALPEVAHQVRQCQIRLTSSVSPASVPCDGACALSHRDPAVSDASGLCAAICRQIDAALMLPMRDVQVCANPERRKERIKGPHTA